jgi:hypothetical protein
MQVKLGHTPEPITQRGVIFLPIVANGSARIDPATSDNHPLAVEFTRLVMTDARQKRSKLTVCQCLVVAATRRAEGLRDGGPWAHVDAQGITPNQYARAAGCNLPDSYAPVGNGIESLVAGSANMAVMLEALANSPKHADHIFGRTEQFVDQDKIGVGIALGGRYGWYIVCMIGMCA